MNVKIETLKRDNYDTWRLQMEALLIKNDAFGYANGKLPKPAENFENWDLADQKARADIILAISPSELKQVKDCKTSNELWVKLESVFQSKGPARKATLLKQLMLNKMKEDDDVREFLSNFFDIVDKLNNMDVKINEDLLTIMLLYSLPDTYENFRCAIETRDELPKPETLKIKIQEQADSMKEKFSKPDDI